MLRSAIAIATALLLTACAKTVPRTPAWKVPGLLVEGQPLIHQGVVYVIGWPVDLHEKRLVALDLTTGRQLWRSEFAADELKLIIETQLYVTDTLGTGHWLDLKTGRTTSPAAPNTLAVASFESQILYVVWTNGNLEAIDRPGHSLWKATVRMNSLQSPFTAGANVYVAGSYGKGKGAAIQAFDRRTGQVRWMWETKEDSVAASADENYAYVGLPEGTGRVLALDANSGKERWTRKTNEYAGAPLPLGGNLVLIRDQPPGAEGTWKKTGYHFLALNSATGQQVRQSSVATKYYAWTLHEGRMFAADRKDHGFFANLSSAAGSQHPQDSRLLMVDLKSGHELWQSQEIAFCEFGQPAFSDGFVVVSGAGSGPGHKEATGTYGYRVN